MKKTFIYSSIVLLLAAVACNKTSSTVSEAPIRFAFGTDATRALVENQTDLQKQTIQVYDDMSGTYYINDKAVYNTGTWGFESGVTYTWRTGSHKFFAYTDGAGAFADNVLTVSKAMTTAEADQVDLLYSDIVKKTEADAGTAVTIPMNHIFSAVSIMIKNGTDKTVTVNKVTVPAIKNQGSVTIDFSGDATAFNYGTVSDASSVFATGVENVELATNKLTDAFATAEATEETSVYWLIWPQTIAKESLTVGIEYTIGGSKYTSELKLPAAENPEWKAGYKYLYTLIINPHDIKLEFHVTAWEENEEQNIIVE